MADTSENADSEKQARETSAFENDTLLAALARHKLTLPAEQVELLDRYARLLWDWNTKMNLTRHTNYERFVSRDVVDSLMLAGLLNQGEQVLDVGTGGGVPGIVLAIVREDLGVALVDSVGKKIKAVGQMVADLKLAVPVYHDHFQEHLAQCSYDSLVVRAVAPLPKLLNWLTGRWGSFRRLLVIKGPAWKDECAAAKQQGLTGRLEINRVLTYPLPGTESESVILEIMTKGKG